MVKNVHHVKGVLMKMECGCSKSGWTLFVMMLCLLFGAGAMAGETRSLYLRGGGDVVFR